MCYYISTLHNFEIIRMKCEFIKDFHGTIWFTHASNIWMRPNMKAQKETDQANENKARINQEKREALEKMI